MRKHFTGYAAFEKETGKAITVSCGVTNRLSLTDDPLKVELAHTKEMAETYVIWFNNRHKSKKEFEIKKAERVIELSAIED
jgi:hypothetical protein